MDNLTNQKTPKIYLLSDTHYISKQLHDQGSAFDRMRKTSAGKDLDYQDLALTAFVKKVIQEKPIAVVITGDLTFNGAKLSAKELAQIFAPLAENKIAFLVLPGNHDIHDGWARKFVQASEYREEEISPSDWKEIFALSYLKAASCDNSSLAYSIDLNSNYRLILADSNIYPKYPSTGHPITNGKISPSQLRWIKQELQTAQKSHQHVLFFMHHNLYRHNDVIHGGFVLDNADELKAPFNQYHVKAVFSGHIHAQNIAGPESDCSAIEVVQSCFSMTDQGYGVLELEPDRVSYQRRSFKMEKYLNAKEKELLPSEDFHQYLYDLFAKTNQTQMSWLSQKIPDPNKQLAIEKLINQLNWNFFIGKNHYSENEKEEIVKSPTYQLIKEKLPRMQAYLTSLMTADKDSLETEIYF